MAYFPSITVTDTYAALKSVLNALTRPPWIDGLTKRLNINNVVSVTGITSVTTVNTVTALTNVGGVPAYGNLMVPTMHNNWAVCVRARIT